MPGTRLYVGGIGPHVRDRDVEKFFKGYGRLRDVLLKNGYGFVEFEDQRDADDAIYELNGRELMGQRVSVESARGPSRRFDDQYGGGGRSGRASYGGDRGRGGDMGRSTRYGPPSRTDHRLIVENLSSRVSWQDLKDYMRQAGEVTYADAHKNDKNEGVVEFASYRDMKYALEKLDDTELNGRRIKLIDDSRGGGGRRSRSYSRSRSRSRSKRRSHSRSRSRSRSRGGKRSKDRDGKRDSRSKSKDRDSRSKSKDRDGKRDSRSKSKDRDSRSKSKDRDSRSKSKDRDSRSKSKSKDRDMNGSKDRSRSGSVVNGGDDKRQEDDHVGADAERKSDERRSKSGSPVRRSGSRSPAPDNGRANGSAPDNDAEEMEG